MARGDLISVSCVWGLVPYRHFGIDIGDGSVIHLAAFPDSGTMQVQRVTWAIFSDDKPVRIEAVRNGLATEEVIRRAEQAVGMMGYHLAMGNCEHFARECKTGESVSHQADRLIGSALRTSLAGAIACSTRAAACAAAYAATSGMSRGIVSRATGVSSLFGELARQGVYAVSRRYSVEHRQADQLGKTAGAITAAIAGSIAGGPVGCVSSAALYLSIDHLTSKAWQKCGSQTKSFGESAPYRKWND